MPTASEEQVPKALTYTLMYHFLWCVMFLLSALGLMALFLASHRTVAQAVLPPLTLVVFALVAGVGAVITYGVRVEVLKGDMTKLDAFQWSSTSSWAILIFVPVALAVFWVLSGAPGQALFNGGRDWSVPASLTNGMVKIELVVWWLSHLLSVRGLTRGRRKLFPESGPTPSPGAPAPGIPALAGKAQQ